ncbi:archaeosortase/exosortase family protein [uncultured Thiodictyon sp.]|uniref:archaeosortase/exosortase family protein n=1 Tax=uncultured Thiodictyon sp. TaxID=1846217 RepID=UPI0025E1A23B|nr:archaeosortase/exosortase family protein [uncultured Thiodictyon sp.]
MIHQAMRRLAWSPRGLWLLTAVLVALNSVATGYYAQGLRLALLSGLVWGGAAISMEDQLPCLTPRPSRFGFLLGSVLLLAAGYLSAQSALADLVVYGLALLQGLSLALLCEAPRRLGRFRDSLIVLACLPMALLLPRLLPDDTLAHGTALLVQLVLLLCGIDVRVNGREVLLEGGSIYISGACSGTEIIGLLSVVAVIFVLAFPLRQRWLRVLVIASAPLFAIAGNALRIALLAAINGSGLSRKQQWLVFFHEENGSLIFAALTVSVFASLYLRTLERQLAASGSGDV